MHFLHSLALATALTTYLLHTHLRPFLTFILTFLPSCLQPPSPVCTFLTIFCTTTVLRIIYNVFIYPHIFSPIRSIPGPKSVSIWNGNYPLMYGKPSGEPHRKWIDELPDEGLIRYLSIFNLERVMPTNAKVLQEVLHTKSYMFEKPATLRNSISQILGASGMLLSEGEQHKIQRRHMLPAFSYRHLRELIPTFWEKSLELVEAMGKEVHLSQSSDAGKQTGVIMEVSRWLNRGTLDIIGSTGFGYEFNCVKNDHGELVRAYRKVFAPETNGQQLVRIVTQYLPLWMVNLVPSKRRREAQEAIAMVKGLCMRMVKEKKREYENGGKVGEKDLLSLITKDSPFDEEEMRDQLMTFLAAGHETTASALTWALYLLSQHPEVQSRLRAEIRSHIPSPMTAGSNFTTMQFLQESLDTLPYLRNVTLEVLRFFPPVPATMRVAAEDTTLGGHYIPKGTVVMLCPWAINRSKKIWGSTADVFDPERWEHHKEGKNGASNYDFMTFLHGPRSCIGKDFSRLEFKALLIALVGRFEFSEVLDEMGRRKEISIKGGITSKPESGMHLWVRAVDGW
ncbi:putative P450 monooxygenase [Kalaharituber pfeilii]|nr:putative P450 monooxygenase [Kalaharituber pfeilii]